MLGFPIDQVKGSRDGDILETANLSSFWAPEKLELNWLAKRRGSDSFTVKSFFMTLSWWLIGGSIYSKSD